MSADRRMAVRNRTLDPCYWQQLTYKLNRGAIKAASLDEELKSYVPEVVSSIELDAKNPEIFDFWGSSVNFDPGLSGPIVNPTVLNSLARLLKQPIGQKEINAGIMRSYGYLLSNAVMPYGLKRQRWTARYIDHGFGWADETLAPVPKEGTLLANLTMLGGRVAFHDAPDRLAQLATLNHLVPKHLRELNPAQLNMRRLIERVKFEHSEGAVARVVELRTDLVRFPNRLMPTSEITHFMVYSVVDSAIDDQVRLISVAPLTNEAADEIFDATALGDHKHIEVRHNAYIKGLSDADIFGSRTVVASSATKLSPLIFNDNFFPPYFFAGRAGYPKGFAQELIEHCVPATGRQVLFMPYPIARSKMLMQSGRIDLNVYSYDPARESFLRYNSEPLFFSSYQPAVRANSGIQISKLADFDPLRIGGLHGLVYSPEFMKYLNGRTAAGNFQIADSEESNLRKLVSSRIDVFLNNKNTILWYAERMGRRHEIKVLDYAIRRANYHVTISRNSKNLSGVDAERFLTAMDSCLRRTKQSDFYLDLVERYHLEK